MANQEHLAILRRGINYWNDWRENNQFVIPELVTPSAEELALNEAFLLERNRFQIKYMRADLSRTDLSGRYLAGINFSEVDLSYSNLRGANLSNADLNGANLRGANLGVATLTAANLGNINLTGANLSYAKLANAFLVGSNLGSADMSFANLWRANLSRSDLILTIFSFADLRESVLVEARMHDTKLRGANLQQSDLRWTYITKVDLKDATLNGASMGWTSLKGTDMSEVKGLEDVKHHGPSSISMDSLYRSRAFIPEVFLKGCGLFDWQIDQIIQRRKKGKTSQVGDYYVFISYSSQDENFASKIHDDLQDMGVRCYYAKESLRIGDEFRQQIHNQIMACDKMLLLISKNSIKSRWVNDEVEAALEEEQMSGRRVLFPIRLDDAVLDIRSGWAATVRRIRNIGDFSGWKNEARYRNAFDRLIENLSENSL